jgi:hypothetical protein
MKKFILIMLAFGLLFSSMSFARNEKHIRVVLDLSKSLSSYNHPELGWPTDEGRLLILSTILLHDLVQPNSTLGDSFEVIPFENDGNWKCPPRVPKAPLPTNSKRRSVVSQYEHRDKFVNAIKRFKYDAPCTYFYPGIRRAIIELKGEGGEYDTRVIILVTDGVPEQHVLDEESMKIQELIPEMKENNIRLYVLAFGKQALINQAFFRPVNEVGGFEIIPDNSKLLDATVKIFKRSFGYTADKVQQPNVFKLNLNGGINPDRAAVVVLSNLPNKPPSINLQKPVNGTLNNLTGIQGAGVKGGSYSLRWILGPNEGHYPFSTDIGLGSVVVLRPTRLRLEIRPFPPKTTQTLKTMAIADFPLKVLVKPPLGVKGDPGAVNISFRTVGKRKRLGKKKCPKRYTWCADFDSVKPGPGKKLKEGREYEIEDLQFRENPEDSHKPYVGYLEIIAHRGEAEVASLKDTNAHRVEVYPYLSIMPFPLLHSTDHALVKREKYCIKFSLELNASYLPHPNRPKYPVRAVLEPSTNIVNKELNYSSFTLDGLPLEFESKQNNPPGEWNKGRLLMTEELLGKHKLCVHIGKPKIGATSKTFEVPLKFTLLESPYDDFRVIKDFTLKMRVIPPMVWPWIVLSILALLALLALFWYSRNRPTLPPDLGYALGIEGCSRLESMQLGEGSPISRLLGFVVEKPVTIKSEEHILAWVRPVKDLEDLYQLRLAKGVMIEPLSISEPRFPIRGLKDVEVQRTYRLHTGQQNYLFRMEYQDFEENG